jgi:hypothetical protein
MSHKIIPNVNKFLRINFPLVPFIQRHYSVIFSYLAGLHQKDAFKLNLSPNKGNYKTEN